MRGLPCISQGGVILQVRSASGCSADEFASASITIPKGPKGLLLAAGSQAINAAWAIFRADRTASDRWRLATLSFRRVSVSDLRFLWPSATQMHVLSVPKSLSGVAETFRLNKGRCPFNAEEWTGVHP